MKHIVLLFAAFLAAAPNAVVAKSTESGLLVTNSDQRVAFTQNRGQVHDQNYKPRPDVLYGVMTGNMAVHIKKGGVSYQLHRVDKFREVEDPKTKEKHREIAQQSIYRIDLNWISHNAGFTSTEDEALPGLDNYYLENCQEGVLNVKTYKGITLTNLYNGINLHYYEKNGELKHDYIVAPRADYKQIQVQVEGAEISVNEDGSLLLTTPLGKVQEGAPLVYQNGRQLNARWQVKNDRLSFEIENYNPAFELLIDPVTRMWGTYYGTSGAGGNGNDFGYSCATDLNGNVYLAGSVNSTTGTGTIIATTGSHQSTIGGPADAFLVKFNTNGTRQWGTYYGGVSTDAGSACATDASGNVYLAGNTCSTTAIATPGSHQPAYGGGNGDAFLVKFDANGVRQWGTYYGGIFDEFSSSCTTDASGNVYLAGYANSNNGIATGGCHQPTNGGGNFDAFLVKFDANGIRQWGTYYGGAGQEVSRSCATDGSGNVYLSGETASNTGTVIATGGSHQPASGGNTEAFLVKFNSSGVRLWGTYYGGALNDYGYSCATDVGGNVYLAGYTNSGGGTSIATIGSHQATYGGDPSDAFLVKFNGNGARQWGTYYGGAGEDLGYSCAVNAAGNVYLSGYTTSNTNTVIASAGSHQPAYGGGWEDAFLVELDANGIRQWGSYYGGPGFELGMCCAVDAAGNVYLSGYSDTGIGTAIATAGSHQPLFAGGYSDAFLAKFEVCFAPPAQPSAISGPTAVCMSAVATYSTPVALGAYSYTWSLPAGWSGSGSSNTISITPSSSGIFTLTAGNGCGASPQQTFNITIKPLPTVVVNSGAICAGESFSIMASGATTYSYSAGPVVSPTTTTFYTVIGTNSLGCSNTAISSVLVNPAPIISVSSGAICGGQSYTMIVGGAITYTYLNGGPIVSPAITNSYSVTGTSGAGCVSAAAGVAMVTVNPLPTVSVSTTSGVLCVGETATLTASGALTYTFDSGDSGPDLTISPGIATTYTIMGTDAYGCSNTAMITQSVDACTAIRENGLADAGIKLYPNPTSGWMNLELNSEQEITFINALGQTVYLATLGLGRHTINLEHLSNGVYAVKARNAEGFTTFKAVKE